jgi:hypothetical protein
MNNEYEKFIITHQITLHTKMIFKWSYTFLLADMLSKLLENTFSFIFHCFKQSNKVAFKTILVCGVSFDKSYEHELDVKFRNSDLNWGIFL